MIHCSLNKCLIFQLSISLAITIPKWPLDRSGFGEFNQGTDGNFRYHAELDCCCGWLYLFFVLVQWMNFPDLLEIRHCSESMHLSMVWKFSVVQPICLIHNSSWTTSDLWTCAPDNGVSRCLVYFTQALGDLEDYFSLTLLHKRQSCPQQNKPSILCPQSHSNQTFY